MGCVFSIEVASHGSPLVVKVWKLYLCNHTSVHALERSPVHTSVFLHQVCASGCLRSSPLLIQGSTTGIIIQSGVVYVIHCDPLLPIVPGCPAW